MLRIRAGIGGRTRRQVITAVAAVTGASALWLRRGPAEAGLFVACVGATLFLVPFIARWATRTHVVALPGGRDFHLQPTPRAGGVALFVPLAATLLVLGFTGHAKALGLFAGTCIVFACGLLDDIRGVRPRTKIVCQMAAGGALLLSGFALPSLGVPGLGSFALGWLQVPVVLLWVVLVTNAFNLSDGIDGLATSLAILGAGVLVAAGVASLLPIAIAGASLSFLYYNMPRARIFLGDCGSLTLGFLVAALALELPLERNLPVALAAVAYSVGDVALAVVRRTLHGKPLFAPDSSHVHHKAIDYMRGTRRGLAVVLLFAASLGALGVLWPSVWSMAITALLWVGVGLLLARLAAYSPAVALQDRGSMQQLHSLRKDTDRRIARAQEPSEIQAALLDLVAGTGVCSLALGGMSVQHPDGCRGSKSDSAALAQPASARPACEAASCQERGVRLVEGHAAWRAPLSPDGGTLLRERETVLVGTIRLADTRLRALRANGSAGTEGVEPPAPVTHKS